MTVIVCVVKGYDDYDRYGGGYDGGRRFGGGGGGYGRDRDAYSGRNRFGGGPGGYGGGRSHGGHVVYMRGLPFSANEHDVLKVSRR